MAATTKDYQATIAELRRQLDEAHKNFVKASALFSSIGEGVIVTDEYGRIEQVNDLCSQLLGYTRRQLIGQHFFKVIRAVNEDGSFIEPLDRPIMRAFLNGAPIVDQAYYLTKNGLAVPMDINVSPFIFNGVPSGAIEVFRDLTDEYVKEEIQSEFISLASHQLRTPLSSINTYAQMLSQGYAGKMNDRQTNFVSVIEHSANRMNELIHSLLNVTRLEAGTITVDVRSVDLTTLCSEIINLLSPQAKIKDIEVELVSNASSDIDSDPILLTELISNLLSNAIKYTHEGGRVKLKIEIKDRIVVSVKDNGFGIPDVAKEYVFSKFYRAKNAVKYDVSGTGLGLYLAKQIAERLEGDIWFDSEVGKGTTFFFSLPLAGSAKKQGRFRLEVP